MSKHKKRILGIFGKEGNDQNQNQNLKAKNGTGNMVLGTIGRIIGRNKSDVTNTENENIEYELPEDIKKKIAEEISKKFSYYGSEDIYNKEKELVETIMKKLYRKIGRVPDCIAIADFLNFDNERIDSFLSNFDKLIKDPYYSNFAVNGNLQILLNLYNQVDGEGRFGSGLFKLQNEEINTIIDATIRDKDFERVYNIFMHTKYAELENKQFKIGDEQLYEEATGQSLDKLIKENAGELLKELIRLADEFKCTLPEAWAVFGTRGDIEPKEHNSWLSDIRKTAKRLAEDHVDRVNNDPIHSYVLGKKRISEDRNEQSKDDALSEGKVSEYIENMKIETLSKFEPSTLEITRLGFKAIGVNEFVAAYRMWHSKNKNVDYAKIDIRKVYQFFIQHGQSESCLVDAHMKFDDVKRTLKERAGKAIDYKTKIPRQKVEITANNVRGAIKAIHKKATENRVNTAVTAITIGGTAVVLVIGGRTVGSIVKDWRNSKIQETESTIKMGATTIEGELEINAFQEFLGEEPEKVPVNTIAIIYPNGNIELLTENGIKQISSNQAPKFGFGNDKSNKDSYFRMGVTEPNTDVLLRDINGDIIKNKYGQKVTLYRDSDVIIIPEARQKNKINMYHVIETKTGKEGYVLVGDIVEKEIEVQEYKIGDQNPTYYLIHTEDGIPVRETPNASSSYEDNIKGYIGFGKQKDFLVVEDKENEEFYRLIMYGEKEDAYIPKSAVEVKYIVQSDGAKEVEKEEEIDPYVENEDFEISENKFATGYTTETYTVEEGLLITTKIEIPKGSYFIETKDTLNIISKKEGKIIKIKGEENNPDSDRAKLKRVYLRKRHNILARS